MNKMKTFYKQERKDNHEIHENHEMNLSFPSLEGEAGWRWVTIIGFLIYIL